MLKKREIILAKIETTYGTDPTPQAASDAVMVEDLNWSHAGARMNERPALRPSLGRLQDAFGGTLLQLTFAAELKGPGVAYSASVRPEIDPLLRACGMAATVVTTQGQETCTYKPASTLIESCTIYYYRDGKVFKLTGCRGTVEFQLEVGAVGKARFTITGHVADEADAAFPTPTFDSTKPPTVRGGEFKIGGTYAAIISALNVNLNNQVATPPDLNAADGYGEIRITGRDVAGSFDPEDVLVATKPFINNWKAGAAAAITTGVIGGTQYNRYKFDLPAVYYREIAPGERDGITTLDITFGAAESSGDDEVSLVFS